MILSTISKYTNVDKRTLQFYVIELGLSYDGGGRGKPLDFYMEGLCKIIGAAFLYKAGFRLGMIRSIIEAKVKK